MEEELQVVEYQLIGHKVNRFVFDDWQDDPLRFRVIFYNSVTAERLTLYDRNTGSLKVRPLRINEN